MYVVNTVGIDTGTGAVAWKDTTSPLGVSPPLPGHDLSEIFQAVVTDHGDDLLVLLRGIIDPSTSFFIDASSGAMLWQVGMLVFATASGPYALAAPRDAEFDYPTILSFDLRTGKTGAQVAGSTTDVRLHIDPDDNDSNIVMSYADIDVANMATEGPRTFLRFSSIDATVKPFVPDKADEVQYQADNLCTLEPGQKVALCRNINNDLDGSVYGISTTSGQGVWKSDKEMSNVTQFHGDVYGTANDGSSVALALDTGRTLSPDLQVGPIMDTDGTRQPIMVNQYGAVGMVGGAYVWVPAIG